MFGKVYKKLAGTTPYYVCVFYGVSEVILKKVIQNPNVQDEFQVDEASNETSIDVTAFGTDYEVVENLDMNQDAINSVNSMMGI